MTFKHATVLIASICTALSGCAGPSGGAGGAAGGTISGSSSSALTAYNALYASASTATATSTLALPATASYTGSANFIIGSDPATGYLGDMTMDVDFSGGTFSGGVTNFASYNTSDDPATAVMTPVSGDLAMSGTYSASYPLSPFIGSATGSINGTSGNDTVTGSVLGTSGQYVLMNFTGSAFSGIGVGQQ